MAVFVIINNDGMMINASVNAKNWLIKVYAIYLESKTINRGKEGEYSKDFMKIKFDTDDNLPLNKPLKMRMLAIIVRSVFEEDGKFYPHVYLDRCLYEL